MSSSLQFTYENIEQGMKEKKVEGQVCKKKKENACQDLPVFMVLLLSWLLHQEHHPLHLPEGSTSISSLPHCDIECEGEINKNF